MICCKNSNQKTKIITNTHQSLAVSAASSTYNQTQTYISLNQHKYHGPQPSCVYPSPHTFGARETKALIELPSWTYLLCQNVGIMFNFGGTHYQERLKKISKKVLFCHIESQLCNRTSQTPTLVQILSHHIFNQ